MGHPRSLDSYGDILSVDDMVVLLATSTSHIRELLRFARSVGDFTHIPPPRLGRTTRKTEWSKDTVRAWLLVSEDSVSPTLLSAYAKQRRG